MLYRDFGQTGKKISVLSMGGMRFPEPENIDKMARIPVAAAKAGINYFDTAPYYCKDQSETIMGKALAEIKRKGYSVYTGSKTNSKTYDGVWRDLEKTLKRLDRDNIDFYYLWCIITDDMFNERQQGGALKALMEIREQGLADHINVSSHQDGDEIKKLVQTGYFDGILLGYNILNFDYREKGVNAAFANNLGVFVMNPLGGGLLTDPRNTERFSEFKLSKNQTMLDASLHFLLLHEQITAALVGFTTLEDVQTAVKAVESFEQVKDTDLAAYKDRIREGFSSLCAGCRYCEYCPEDIPVSKLMDTYNYWILYQDKKQVRERLKFHWNLGTDEAIELIERCTECGTCESKCTQKLPIINRLQELQTVLS